MFALNGPLHTNSRHIAGDRNASFNMNQVC